MQDTIGEYRVQRPLAEGAFGQLVLAEGPRGEAVVIKRLKLDKLVDNKALELFGRETGVLRSLRHRAVPRFIDSGVDDEGLPYLVQEHIDGPTLEAAVKGGRRFDARSAERLARDLLDALEYLHDLHPPVIHRDIKPANIVLEGDRPVLVDFGAVCGYALFREEAATTVVGTFGYMAPEMLKGQASPASDLYALGATLLFAFSGREPETFPTERLRIRFRDVLKLEQPLAALLEALLEPAAEDRPQSAAEARALLAGRRGALQRRGSKSDVPAEKGAEDGEGGGEVVKRRTIGGLPLKPIVAVGSLVALGVLVLLFPDVFKLIAIGAVILVVLVVVLLLAAGGV